MLLAALIVAPLVELEWDAPASCPSAAAFEEMVREQADVRAQRDPPRALETRVTIREHGPNHWELELSTERDATFDAKTFEGETCREVVQVAAMVVSLRVVESVESQPVVPEPQPPSTVEPTPAPISKRGAPLAREPIEHVEPSVPQPARTRRQQPIDLGGWLGVRGGVALGIGPGVGGAVAIDGGVEGRWWRAGLGLQTTPRRLQPHPNDAAVRGRFDLLVADAFGCGVPRAGAVAFPICGRLSAGGLRAVGQGDVERSEPAWGPWWGVGGSGAVVWHVTERLAPSFSLEALAPLRDWAFSVGSVPGVLHQTGAVAVRAWAGLEIHL